MPLLKVTNRYSAWQRESALRITEVHVLLLVCHSEPPFFGGEESLLMPHAAEACGEARISFG